MTTIYCQKLQKEAPAMPSAPFPGQLGEKILSNISAEAWDLWLQHQTMLINEYRLNLLDQSAKDFLKTEMQKFLFEGGAAKPNGYTPE